MKFLVLAVCVVSATGSILPYAGVSYGTGSGIGSPLAYQGSRSPLAYGGSPYGGSPFGGYANQASIIAGAGIVSPLAFAAPIHFPTLVQHPSGAVTPADEPAVVVARTQHLRAKAVAYANEAQSIAAGAYGSGAYGVTGQIY